MSRRILVVDDDRTFRLSTAELLRQDGHLTEVAADAREAMEHLEAGDFDLMLLDLRMPGLDGLGFVEVVRKRGFRLPIVMISGFGTIDSAVEAIHLGADDFLTKPLDPDLLSSKVAEALERRPAGASDRGAFGGLVGRSPPMKEVFAAIRQVAATETTVLVTGETGTGKELVARAVHEKSRRSGRPFLAVNCAGLAEGVLESELFGHVKGAFTGAIRDKEGLFAAAEGGTILLDEVGDVSLRLQQRLLRVLQEREVTPVGAVKPRSVDVRIVAATHRDLRAELEAGRFREDLFYRLNVFRISLPPLRERREDIPLLIEEALRRLRDRSPGTVPESISPLALRILRRHDWPGNVRELFAAVESAAVRAGGRRIEAQHLPAEIRGQGEGGVAEDERYRPPDSRAEERAAIVAALEEADGVRTRAARLLGMSRTTLWRRMKEFGLDEES
ncbi:MAG: sigma-54 dependent transcriptional regulator [Longimicrobiales bacterium]|nr:sigma-54 dependent transcriptional regulator [Longimicrobiales bacterium]